MQTRSRWGAVAVGLFGFVLSSGAIAPRTLAAQPSLVVLVRHGEKATEGGSDPSLSAAGRARAQALADALAMTTPNAIIVTSLKRTAETAAVVSAKTGVVPTVITIGNGAKHIADVATAVRKATGVVLVVGHSNTVPAIVKALGGPKLPDLCDSSYATMFVLTPGAEGKAAQVVLASYGAADGPLLASCTGMVVK
ncbi:phosphoglycerate mutase family protein [Gemmatimonas sp.]|uniref:phosphoglycerate mutase family protein n=1 Tax=Gemmatimonas sp. TaxID=1962908 RepID=UPI003565D082